MVFNKKRLYVALYPSGVANNEERMYHWGFLIGLKLESQQQVPGVRYHVKNSPLTGWVYEEAPLPNVRSTVNLLARVLIAKIEDEDRLVETLRGTPVVQDDPAWRCSTRLANALRRIQQGDGPRKAVGTAQLDWARIEPVARDYVARKRASGRYERGVDLLLPKPTWDLLEERELVA
ncbi:hypothetical protein C8A01DRAFT_31794 [Parachaetomium inaequale]|uniref:Uncharacterized protein n=1 Tax=Parachaetomium inaequale TaxID=2588326 RepID=A0AAN6PNU3_9PEZI|nr:hypothetical protein C8A01DRAFT_31794 [Parachaetomium inaequale]